MKLKLLLILPFIFLIISFYFSENYTTKNYNISSLMTENSSSTQKDKPQEISPLKDTSSVLPEKKLIQNLSYVHQSFNNCSSVGLMITLSRWGIFDTQEKIAEATRPWNNQKGDNDDKSVTLYELADYAKNKHNMLVYVRPNGNIETLKKFVANDIPVLTRALMYPKDDIVHYRVIRGYDDTEKILIESDGVEGEFKAYTYDTWMKMWEDFNYSYLIIVPKEKQQLAEKLLGEELDETIAWKNAKKRAEETVSKKPNNLIAQYNTLIAMYYLGDYTATVKAFEDIENKVTRRKLWYQPEPIYAYSKLNIDDRVISLVDKIANDNNKSISELYVLKGDIYKKQGDIEKAKIEYDKALYYNKHLLSAKKGLETIKN